MIALLVFDAIVIIVIIYLIIAMLEEGKFLILLMLIVLVTCGICAGGAIENIRLSDSESDNSKIIDIDTSSKNTIIIKIK